MFKDTEVLDCVEVKIRNRVSPHMDQLKFLGDVSFLKFDSGFFSYVAIFEAEQTSQETIDRIISQVSFEVMEELGLDGFCIKSALQN